ncbi:penicillin-binding protein transpeptidase [Neobacillus bataviensis LMG 21833]|uniref:serine-type D-Ala-D-Ala carboxypeptidase n=1 Tax=Neobacillus bataviensis LMG 21833 TaxID=1117379 RepID=K6CF92_9BACI|nr:penicillin-binding protein 2 [Neobacillus bataviensis]EKN69825.1 penicillin-binding protein transpeptidase [Neobacillus bataviensis LMG 21833]
MKQKMQKENIVKNPIRWRLTGLFFMVFVLFSILILRLGVIQIIKGEAYAAQAEKTDVTPVSYSVPRGKIYDTNHKLVVYNIPEKAIIYTPPKNPQQEELLELAKKLNTFLVMTDKEINKVTDRDLKDIWLLEHNNGTDLITKKEEKLYEQEKLNDRDLYQLKLKRITESELKKMDKNLAAIYRKLSTAIALTLTMIKNENVTEEEFAKVNENLDNLPGVDVTTDWKRGRTYGETFWNMLGEVTSADEGLPAEKVDYYTAKGYKLNDRVGKSYIEELYDSVLQGRKEKVKTVTDQNGNVVSTETVSEGKSGKDLVLTIDMEFQAQVEKIMQEELVSAIQKPHTDTLDTAFVVAMEPKTGRILAMSGKVYDRKSGEFTDFTPGTFTYAFEQGSVVKGATVLTGYQTGVRDFGEIELDEVMRFKGSGTFSSYQVMNRINELEALERSSNVYMWKTAIEIMGGKYVPNGTLNIDPKKIETIRYYFNQFGLGIPTGIGFDNETAGMKGTNTSTYFQIAIGQLDTYTPMQIAQYITTIANGGYRMKPQLVKEIREPNEDGNEPGNVIDEIEPVVLNQVDMSAEMLKRVQQGFWLVTHGSKGTARGYFKDEPYNAAGKTGTSESYKNGVKTWNLSFAGYAPFDDPEIAIAVIVPNAYRDGYAQPHSAANIISQRVFRAYFDLNKKGWPTTK